MRVINGCRMLDWRYCSAISWTKMFATRSRKKSFLKNKYSYRFVSLLTHFPPTSGPAGPPSVGIPKHTLTNTNLATTWHTSQSFVNLAVYSPFFLLPSFPATRIRLNPFCRSRASHKPTEPVIRLAHVVPSGIWPIVVTLLVVLVGDTTRLPRLMLWRQRVGPCPSTTVDDHQLGCGWLCWLLLTIRTSETVQWELRVIWTRQIFLQIGVFFQIYNIFLTSVLISS